MTQNLKITNEWDKIFKLSDKVNHKKITFHNRFGITLVGDLYEPKEKGDGKVMDDYGFMKDHNAAYIRIWTAQEKEARLRKEIRHLSICCHWCEVAFAFGVFCTVMSPYGDYWLLALGIAFITASCVTIGNALTQMRLVRRRFG